MLVEIGVQNVAKALTFQSNESADEVNAQVEAAVNNNTTLKLTDEKVALTLFHAKILLMWLWVLKLLTQ